MPLCRVVKSPPRLATREPQSPPSSPPSTPSLAEELGASRKSPTAASMTGATHASARRHPLHFLPAVHLSLS